MSTTVEGVTIKQAAQRVGVTPLRIRQIIAEGKLPYIATPYGKLIDESDLVALIESRRDNPQNATPDQ
jgi:excisionase family DNA binding protein